MDIDNLFKDSYSVFMRNIVAYIIAAFIVTIGSILIIPAGPLTYGLMYMAAKGSRGETVQVNDVFEGFKPNRFMQSVIFGLIIFVPIIIGLLLFVIPGMILIVLFSVLFVFAEPLMVLQDAKAIVALKQSVEIAKVNTTDAIIMSLIVILFNMLGSIIWIGVLFTLPFTMIVLVNALPEAIKGTTII